MQLSIIIPYYNAKESLDAILDVLAPQMQPKEVEVIIIDDGSKEKYKTAYKWAKVYRQRNGGTGQARNAGMNKAKGDYITFIDADDMIVDYYIPKILEKIKEGFDLCEMSWKTAEGHSPQFNYKLNSDSDRLTNPAVWCRVFNRQFLGDIRFSEYKDSTEDEDFSRRVGYLDPDFKCNRVVIKDYMYIYYSGVEDSQSKLFRKGYYTTRRVVYYYNHVTKDMKNLVKQIKEDDKYNEVFLMTNRCDIPELRRWCQIIRPMHIWTHYLKGDPYDNCEVVKPMVKTQVAIYIQNTNSIGGIETFILHFAKIMGKYYDIVLMINNVTPELRARYSRLMKVVPATHELACDTLIMMRIIDDIPKNVHFRKSIRMCHACRTADWLHLKDDSDVAVCVSQASKTSFEQEGERAIVIHNPIVKTDKKALLLVSATRIPAIDKGYNEKRMRILADKLIEADIPFLWFNFSDGNLNNAPKGFVNVGTFQGCQEFIARADYLVQLSDCEAYSYSILEALVNNTPVIVTPFESATEQGVVDGENGYIVPFDMDFDVKKLLNIPEFEFEYDNEPIVKQWRELLGNKKPKHDYDPEQSVRVRATRDYFDVVLRRNIARDTILEVDDARADALVNANVGVRV